MITRVFTNRRRAKDAILAYIDLCQDKDLIVRVLTDGLVCVQYSNPIGDNVFYFGVDSDGIVPHNQNDIIELYQHNGIRRFKA